MKGFSRALILAVLIFLIPAIPGLLGMPAIVLAQTDERYFEETGYSVRGPFLTFFNSAADPLLVFGYPISDQIIDESTGRIVQYFQRTRFDLVKTLNGEVVQTALLGQDLYDSSAPVTPGPEMANSMACQKFQSTGFSVCYSFLRFYEDNNGAAFFGSPISDVEMLDGHYVQYFESARLEWQPENPAGERVVLADLGRIYYDQKVGKYEQGQSGGSAIPQNPNQQIRPQSHAFVSQALIPANNWQTLYVVVQDQKFQPIKDAMVTASVYFPDGSQYDVRTADTNQFGVTNFTFLVKNMPVKEIVRVDVNVEYQSVQSKTSTWFRIWW